MTTTREDVGRWIAAGLIDQAAADRILAFEEERAANEAPSERPGVIELLIYLAAAIVAAGTTVLLATNWEHLGTAPRIAIPALSALAVLAAGQWLRQTGNAPILRGASLLWLLGGALIVATVAIAGSEFGASENNVALFAGIAAVVASLVLWYPMRMHPQIVGIGGAEFLFSLAVSVRADRDWQVAVLGFVLALFGLAGLIAAEGGVLVPRPSARLLAGAGLAAGAFWAGLPPSPPIAELLALAVVVVLLAAGTRYQSLVYVAFGVLTAFSGMLKLILRHVESPTLAGLALIAIGLLLLLAIAGLRKAQPWAARGAAHSGAI